MIPKYTIIIPVYNVGPWISACLDSVMRQNVSAWECICVDDGSTDESADILDRYAQRDCRFRVIHKINGGVSSSRNVALDNARGEWVVYIDGDDLINFGALDIFETILSKFPDVEMMHYEVRSFPEKEESPYINQNISEFPMTVLDDAAIIFSKVCGICFPVYAYKREVVGDIRFDRFKIGEDRLYLAKCLARCKRLAFCRAVGYLCRRRLGSASRSSETLVKFQDEISAKLGILHESQRLHVVLPKRASRMLICIITEHALANIDRLTADEEVRQAWSVWFAALDKIPNTALVTLWQKTTVRFLRRTRSKILARMLCLWPHKLKLMRTKARILWRQ